MLVCECAFVCMCVCVWMCACVCARAHVYKSYSVLDPRPLLRLQYDCLCSENSFSKIISGISEANKKSLKLNIYFKTTNAHAHA